MESRRLADLGDDNDILSEEQHETVVSSPGSTHHNIQVLKPAAIAIDASYDRRRSVAAERALSRSFIVRDCRRYSLVSRRGTVSIQHSCFILFNHYKLILTASL